MMLVKMIPEIYIWAEIRDEFNVTQISDVFTEHIFIGDFMPILRG